MNPVMFCRNTIGVSWRLQSWMNCAPFWASSLKRMPLLARMPTGKPLMLAQPVTSVLPYSGLNSSNRLPSTMRAIASRASNGMRTSAGAMPSSSSGSYAGASAGIDGPGPSLRQRRCATIWRPIRRASGSSAAR